MPHAPTSRMSRTSFVMVSLAVLCASAPAMVGCAEESSERDSDLTVDSTKLPVFLDTAQAGDPFFPLGNEAPLQIGETPCLGEPKVRLSSLSTELLGSVVVSKLDMTRKMELSSEGVPFTLKAISGSASGKLASNTSFSRGSINLLFQVVGRYSAELAGARTMHRFAPEAVSRCGLGYLTRSEHRLASMVLITVESDAKETALDLGLTGAVNASSVKGALANTLRRGKYTISIRSVTEGYVDPQSDPLPLGGFAVLRSTEGSSQEAERGVSQALDWLGRAQQNMRIPATLGRLGPATSVQFKYYPGTPDALRVGLSKAYDGLLVTRSERQDNFLRQRQWQDVETAIERGRGSEFNVKDAPVKSVVELQARLREAQAPEGAPAKLENVLADREATCLRAMSNPNDGADVGALVTGLSACDAMPPDVGVIKFNVAPLRMHTVKDDNFAETGCPANTHRPTLAESALLEPMSRTTGERGIWLDIAPDTHLYRWFREGKIETRYFNAFGVSVCISNDTGLL
jgi:hypothetical protein